MGVMRPIFVSFHFINGSLYKFTNGGISQIASKITISVFKKKKYRKHNCNRKTIIKQNI